MRWRAWDVRRAKTFGRCEATTGITRFERWVEDVMSQEPDRSARRVFWIFDNGSSHRGRKAVRRLQVRWPSIIPVPRDFASLAFQHRYEKSAAPLC